MQIRRIANRTAGINKRSVNILVSNCDSKGVLLAAKGSRSVLSRALEDVEESAKNFMAAIIFPVPVKMHRLAARPGDRMDSDERFAPCTDWH